MDKVFLTGGASLVPAVRDLFIARFGAARVTGLRVRIRGRGPGADRTRPEKPGQGLIRPVGGYSAAFFAAASFARATRASTLSRTASGRPFGSMGMPCTSSLCACSR